MTPRFVLQDRQTGPRLTHLLLLFVSCSAAAQQTDSDTALSEIEKIQVTAQKRITSVQETPVAISAFSGDMLETRGIDDLNNLQSYVPALHAGQEQDGFKISLRGIGLQGTSSISDSGVAFYVDDNYIARPAGGAAILFDIEHIEVLRGPQGTLYGRNATGGVINVISNRPADEFEARVGLTLGERNLHEIRGMINVPISDALASRFSVVYSEEDGYVKKYLITPRYR